MHDSVEPAMIVKPPEDAKAKPRAVHGRGALQIAYRACDTKVTRHRISIRQ
jgi:hypothetical protein